ncbi:MAG: ROK family protein [Cyclobacteriaceae bacterium]
MKEVAIGIDIGGTTTAIGLIEKDGNILAEKVIDTPRHGDIELFISQIEDAVKADIEVLKVGDINIVIKGIGIGAPNGNYYHGTIEYAPNLSFKGVVPFVELMKKHFNYDTIVLTNDANAAAIGEMMYGGAKGMRDFIEITLGTGLGSGIVVNGELVYGNDGFAGELGHITVERNGRMCPTGRRGSLETYASATGIKRTVFAIMADSIEESELRDVSFNQLTSKMIYDAAKKGDKIALEAFDVTARYLGRALADTVMHTSPEAIFLFGGLANAGDLIIGPTKNYMEKDLLQIFQNKVKILPSKLEGAKAAFLGASALVWKELEKQG